MQTHEYRDWNVRKFLRHRFALLVTSLAAVSAGAILLPLPGHSAPSTEASAKSQADVPLLRWDLLRQTYYNPPVAVTFPDSLRLYDGKKVRMEGYIMPNFGAQDQSDLLLTGLHPRSLFCGPTDMTALVQVYMPGFDPVGWPTLPIEMVGTFFLSKRPMSLHAIYYMNGISWRPLRTWEQDFPGTVDELQGDRDMGDR
jgi:hypothetical protein